MFARIVSCFDNILNIVLFMCVHTMELKRKKVHRIKRRYTLKVPQFSVSKHFFFQHKDFICPLDLIIKMNLLNAIYVFYYNLIANLPTMDIVE